LAFLNTFSIVARDELSGQMGVAVQSHWFAVGALCPWAEAGVGVIATQSMVEVSYGPQGLELLKKGKSAQTTLDELLSRDAGRALRQVAILDAQGRVAVHTGERCIQAAGHQSGPNFCVQANMMLNKSVWPSMAAAFQEAQGSLAFRLLAALKAGQAASGDIRGMQSAGLLVVDAQKTNQPWKHVLMDLRVDDAPDPIAELERLIKLQSAYDLMNAADELMLQDDSAAAHEKYCQAAEFAPDMDEIPFWQAVTLADNGNLEEALPIFRNLFQSNPNWALLAQRLPASGLLRDDAQMMQIILQTQESQ